MTLEDFSDAEILELIALGDTAVGNPMLDRDAHDLSLAFRAAAERELPVAAEILTHWIEVARPQSWPRPGLDAIAAARFNDDPQVLAALRNALSNVDSGFRVKAAEALADRGDKAAAPQIAHMLARLDDPHDGLLFGFATAALEKLGDPGVAPLLQDMIATASDRAIYWLVRAIRRLTGHCPALPEADDERFLDEVRTAWAGVDLSRPVEPRVIMTPMSSVRAEAVVDDGRDIFALEPDDRRIEATWPEWDFSWCHAGERLYGVGSSCSTCEVVLQHVGWSPVAAYHLAQSVRQHVADVRTLDTALLDALAPLLGAFASSRYQVRLIDLPLIPATWADTWYAAGSESADNPPVDDVRLYQLPSDDGRRTPLVVASTQPTLDPQTVTTYARAIEAGARPAAVVAAYAVRRQAWNATEPHDSVIGFIIDGHHKLAAYAELGLPARILLVCDRRPRIPAYLDNYLAPFDAILNGCSSA
jgi:hypothetical protein